jgi:protein-disulfide isomerase
VRASPSVFLHIRYVFQRKEKKVKNMILTITGLILLSFFLTVQVFAQEDQVVKAAMEIVRSQARLPKGVEVKFIEKKESQIPGFYSVKLLLMAPDKEIPVVVYVDETGEKVIFGQFFVKGENVTRKEAGEPKPRKIDMGQLDMEKSPFKGPAQARVTIVEFSNFQCPYCLRSWRQLKPLMGKYPQDIRYVFKHYPLQPQGGELSEMVAATQEVSNGAFWEVHDFFFSDEGQTLVNKGKDVWRPKIEEILKGKGYDVKAFQDALEKGAGKRRVEEDVAAGNKIPVTGTPTTIMNGEFIRGGINEKMLERYLGK